MSSVNFFDQSTRTYAAVSGFLGVHTPPGTAHRSGSGVFPSLPPAKVPAAPPPAGLACGQREGDSLVGFARPVLPVSVRAAACDGSVFSSFASDVPSGLASARALSFS